MWQRRFQQYHSDRFTVVGLALDIEGIPPAKKYYDKFNVTFPALVDANYATGFQVVPHTFFVDEWGVIQPSKQWEDWVRSGEPVRPVPERVRKQWSQPDKRLGPSDLASLVERVRRDPQDMAVAVELASRYLDLSLPEEARAVLERALASRDPREVARSGDDAATRLMGRAYFQLARACVDDRDEQVRCATLSFYLAPSIGFGKQIARLIAPEKFDDRPGGDFDNAFREATLRRLRKERETWLEGGNP